jgi:transcriptional regulator with XRE-family HTH domain
MTNPLKEYRSANGLTQGQLAGMLGVSDATITHIENGRRRITPENANAWASILGLSRAVLCPGVFLRSTKKQKATV